MSCRGSGVVEATKTVEIVIPGGKCEVSLIFCIFNLILGLKHASSAMK